METYFTHYILFDRPGRSTVVVAHFFASDEEAAGVQTRAMVRNMVSNFNKVGRSVSKKMFRLHAFKKKA